MFNTEQRNFVVLNTLERYVDGQQSRWRPRRPPELGRFAGKQKPGGVVTAPSLLAHLPLTLSGLFSVCLALAPAAMAQGQTTRGRQLSELSLEDLMQVQVVTASRVDEKLIRASSVMSVITARDIERAGFRTIADVLARVPGFFPSSQATWKLVGTRGLVADGNDHILLLVDGHAQNSIVAHGFQQQDQIPALEKVERIEIIRGPASVMWGASAAHAIINVVTKDELQDQKSMRVSAGYGGGDGLWTVNLLKDIRMGEAKGVISASYWKADGYDTPDGPNVKFPWGAFTNLWPRLDAQNPGFELYLKLKDGDRQQILARVVQTSVPYPWDSWSYDPAGGVRPGSELRMRRAYLDYQTTKPYGDRFKIHTPCTATCSCRIAFRCSATLQMPRWTRAGSRTRVARSSRSA